MSQLAQNLGGALRTSWAVFARHINVAALAGEPFHMDIVREAQANAAMSRRSMELSVRSGSNPTLRHQLRCEELMLG